MASAAVSVTGDILRLFVDVESASSATGTAYAFVFSLYLIGAVLLLLGVVGLYVSQAKAASVLELTGILQLANAVFGLVMGLDYLAFLFILALLSLIAGFFALAWRFWRKTPRLAPEGSDALV